MRVLLTGTNGFIGSHLALSLPKGGHEVIALHRSEPAEELRRAGVELFQQDLSQSFELPSRIDAVVHAASTSPWVGVRSADMIRDNVVATRNLVDAALRAGVDRFVYLSSISIHGQVQESEVDEETPRLEPDDYGRTKYMAERLVAEHRLYGT